MRADNIVGQEGMGFLMMATVMNGERIVGCIGMLLFCGDVWNHSLFTKKKKKKKKKGSLRGARTCLAEAIKYARQRNTFGKRLIDHQVCSSCSCLHLDFLK